MNCLTVAILIKFLRGGKLIKVANGRFLHSFPHFGVQIDDNHFLHYKATQDLAIFQQLHFKGELRKEYGGPS